MKTLRVLFILILLPVSFWGYSQEKVITWQTETILNFRNGEQTQYICLFKIYPGDKIEWIQSGGSNITVFNIVATEGELPEGGSGKITYPVMKEGLPGKIILERSGSGKTILILDFSSLSAQSAYYKFELSNQ